MYDDPGVVGLVVAARDGDRAAWDRIIERYAPLVWSICVRYRLDRPDADDVGQTVWLKLFEHLMTIREPAALPGWLATTTRNECVRLLRTSSRRENAERAVLVMDEETGYLEVERELAAARRHAALLEAFAGLRPQCRELLSLLFADPPTPYRAVGARLGMKVGSIGPTRERCLAELRRSPALATLIKAEREEDRVR
jgi:RNA polymerase sigma factor (sigma-70 family)